METLTKTTRLGKENSNKVYNEMKSLGYITYHGKRAGLQIEVPLKDLT